MVILSGDHLYRMDYMDFVQKHRDSGADITISCVPMDDRYSVEPQHPEFPSENSLLMDLVSTVYLQISDCSINMFHEAVVIMWKLTSSMHYLNLIFSVK